MASTQPAPQQIPLTTDDFFKDLPQDLQAKLAACTKEIEKIDMLNDAAWRLNSSNPDEALRLAEETYRLAISLNYKKAEADSLRTMSAVNWREFSNYEASLQQSQRALSIYQSLNDWEGLIQVYNSIGSAYTSLGKYQLALKHLFESQSLSIKHHHKNGEASAPIGIGRIYLRIGEYKLALDYFDQALVIGKSIAKKDVVATCLSNIGIIHYERMSYSKAIEVYEEALEMAGEMANWRLQMNTLNNMGNVYVKLCDYDKANSCYEKAMKLAEDAGNIEVKAALLDNMARIQSDLGHYALALNFHHQGLQIAEQIGDKVGIAETTLHIGQTYLREKDIEKAIAFLNKALILIIPNRFEKPIF